MARTKTDKQTREVSNISESTKPTHGLAFSSKMLQEHKDIDQNLVDSLSLQRIRRLSWLTFGDAADLAMIEAVKLYESLEPQSGIEAIRN